MIDSELQPATTLCLNGRGHPVTSTTVLSGRHSQARPNSRRDLDSDHGSRARAPSGACNSSERADPGPTFDLPLLPHWRVDPRAINAYLIRAEVPTFCASDRERPLTSKRFGARRRWWARAVSVNNDRLLQGQSSGTSKWLSSLEGRALEDALLLRRPATRKRALPGLTATHERLVREITGHALLGASWRLRKAPPTTCAAAKATLLLCPRKPAAPLPDFWSLPPGKRGRRAPRDRGQRLLLPASLERKGNAWGARETCCRGTGSRRCWL